MRASQVLIGATLALGAVAYATLGLASVATAQTAVSGGPSAPTCYVVGYAPIASVNLVFSLGEC